MIYFKEDIYASTVNNTKKTSTRFYTLKKRYHKFARLCESMAMGQGIGNYKTETFCNCIP